MREIGIALLSLFVIPTITNAAGISAITSFIDPSAARIIGVVLGILALAIIWAISGMLLSVLNCQKYIKLVEKACFVGAASLVLGIVTDFAMRIVTFFTT